MTDLDLLLDYLSKQWLPYEVSEARKRLMKPVDVEVVIDGKAFARAVLTAGIPLTDGAGIPQSERRD